METINKKYLNIFVFFLCSLLLYISILKMSQPICKRVYYFDNNATTPVPEVIADEMKKWISCGNPSNVLYDCGRAANKEIALCRKKITDIMGVEQQELFFTSGATESNNLLIKGVANYFKINNPSQKFHIITSSFEHPSVLAVCKFLEDTGFEVTYVKPDSSGGTFHGTIDPKDIENNIKSNTILITIMHGNNETGALQDLHTIGSIGKKHKIFTHSDCTQTMGKFIIKPKELGLDSISFSGHKFHGPKGIGGLYITDTYQSQIIPLSHGGDQESSLRPGTENVANIVGMSYAYELAQHNRSLKNKILRKLKNRILQKLTDGKLNFKILGPLDDNKTNPNTILIMFPDMKGCNQTLVDVLNRRDVCVSVGSACKTKASAKKPSHVLEMFKLTDDDKIKVIRISMSDYTSKQEVDYLVSILLEVVPKIK